MTAHDTARAYLRRGFAPIPVPYRTKRPTLDGWQELRLAESDLARYFNGREQNIGILNGAPSGDLVDVDVDASKAAYFRHWLPPTELVAGREGNPASHWFYRAPGVVTMRYQDPHRPEGRTTLIELRSTGTQTVVPPSLHPSGEPYRWERDGDPALSDAATLRRAVARIAAGALLARYWPSTGSRHDASLALAGWLLRGGWEEDEAARFIDTVAEAAGDEEHRQRVENIRTTARRLRDGGEATGAPSLARLLTDDGDAIITRVAEWLDLAAGRDNALPPTPQINWEPPISLGAPALPPFPLDALPPAFGDFAAALATATQTPPDLAGLHTLAALATATARKAVVRPRPGWSEPLNLFTASVLGSGNRKSAVHREIVAPLDTWERGEIARLAPEYAAKRSRRRIQEGELRKAERSAAEGANPMERAEAAERAERLARELAVCPEAVDPQLLADDATPEAVKTLLAEQGGRLALLSPEATVFELMAGRYSPNGGPNLEVYLQGHAGDAIRVNRRGRRESIDNPALTVGVMIQPDALRAFADRPAFRGRGLVARFFYSLPESYVGRRAIDAPPIPATVRDAYATALTGLLDLPLPDEPPPLVFDAHAARAFAAFQAHIEPQLGEFGRLGEMADWGSKLPGAVARVAGLLHLARHTGTPRPWDEPIDTATMESAIAIGEYAIPHALAAASAMGLDGDDGDARYLLRWLAKEGKPHHAHQAIWQGTRGRFEKAERLDRALDRLAAHRIVRARQTDERTRPGRKPKPDYDVTPYPLPTIPTIPTIEPTDDDVSDSRDFRDSRGEGENDDEWGAI
jgi:replicative DNA helicase